jgi:phage-related protein
LSPECPSLPSRSLSGSGNPPRDWSKREARVLFGFYEGILIALHAFIKKTQKTAPNDLTLTLTLTLAGQRFKEMSS